MIGRRKKNLTLGMSRLYVYQGKRVTTYYTITPANERINLGHDLKEAKRKLLAMDGEIYRPGTVGELLADLMDYRQSKVSAGKLALTTLQSNELEVEELKKVFGKMRPEDVKPMHVWQYLHKYRGKESPVRANREIALLSSMFNRAMGAGIVDRNPCVGVERNEETPRDRLVSDRELKGFCKFAWNKGYPGRRIALALAIAYLTGKGQGQIIRLATSQLNAEGITFGKRKRGAATLVEWSRRLKRYVQAALDQPCDIVPAYVIRTQRGSPYTSSGFKSIWQRLINEWVEKGNERFTFHDLRAKTVTDVIEQGRKASELTGHKTESIVASVYDRRRVRKARAVK